MFMKTVTNFIADFIHNFSDVSVDSFVKLALYLLDGNFAESFNSY